MTHFQVARRDFLRSLAATGSSLLVAGVCAAEPDGNDVLREPVFRVAKARGEVGIPERHPLDPALAMAKEALALIQRDIVDYTCRIAKRERIKGELGKYEYMDAKIRNRKLENGKLITPLSVYLRFVSPPEVEGREVIWVEGRNGGKMKAHEGGVKGRFLPSVWLDPDGPIAMRGQLHPIYDIGIENLVEKLIERGEKEKRFGKPEECEVKFISGAKITLNGKTMVCTVLLVQHPVQRPYFEFHRAEVFIDDQLKIPVRYAAYYWPEQPGQKEPVLEEYTYTNIKLNVGLTDADFDPENPNYNF